MIRCVLCIIAFFTIVLATLNRNEKRWVNTMWNILACIALLYVFFPVILGLIKFIYIMRGNI